MLARPPARGAVEEPAPGEEDAPEQMAFGPLSGGIAEAGRFRLVLEGGTVARAEARLGWLHKGIPALMRGKSPRAASRFAARLAGDAAVAHGIAFARAAEIACDTVPPARALALRAAMAEAERMASHLADIEGLALAAGAPLAAAFCQRHGEALRRASARAFGHRLMMDVVVPGGLAVDLAPEGEEVLRAAAAALGRELGELARLCGPLLRRLEGVATVPAALAEALAPGGPAGRANGRDADLRRAPGYRPYHDLVVSPVREAEGDATARLLVWLAELRDSARMLRTVLAELPQGEIVAALPMATAEGFGWAEGPRGDVWTWLRLEGGQIAGAFQRDPGWLHLPMLEAAAAGLAPEEWAIARASFGLSHAGMDL
jgi:Ni,Fe-hydrogenase III large subunit